MAEQLLHRSQVDEPEQDQELDSDRADQQAVGSRAEGAQRRYRAAASEGVGHLGEHDGGEHHRRQGGQRRPAGRQRRPRMPAEEQGCPDGQHRQGGNRLHRAEEPERPGKHGKLQRTGRSGPRWPLHHPRLGSLGAKARAGSRAVPMSRARICSTDRARGIHAAGYRLGRAGQGGVVDLEVVGLQHPGVDRDAVAFDEEQHVAGHQLGRGNPPLAAVAQGGRFLGEQGGQRPGGPFGPVLLDEAERAVDDHDRDDRPAELGHLADEGQHRGHPEQQREEVEELGGELAWEARSSGLREPVRTCELQPCGGLLVRQAAGVDPQLPQDRLGRWQRRQPRQRCLATDRGRDRRSRCTPTAVSVAAVGGRGCGGLHSMTVTRGAAGRQGRGSRRMRSIGPCPLPDWSATLDRNRGGSRCVGPSA